MSDYKKISNESRKKVLDLICLAGTSHIGSNFSCADILAVLFEKIDLNKDVFILSAGWKAAMLYYHLWRKNRITKDELNSYCQPGSKWIGLAEPVCDDIKIAGGSMSMGLAGANGIALAKKLNNEEGHVYVLESDGGINGGIFWEAVAVAAHHKLNNLTLIIDHNGFQAMGKTEDILNIPHFRAIMKNFGWIAGEIDGHDFRAIEGRLNRKYNQPSCIIAKTIKGKGVSFMENNNDWHYRQIDNQSYELAKQELG